MVVFDFETTVIYAIAITMNNDDSGYEASTNMKD